MTFVGITGILLSFIAFFWFSPRRDNSRLALFVVIAVLHIAAAYVYYSFVQTSDADTKLYYFDVYGFYEDKFAFGTVAVVHITQWLKMAVGGTYFDFFLLYQMLGVWGIALVMRTMQEAADALDTPLPALAILLLFLPGMYFWTSAIGKDAPLFVACALAVWSCFRISSRWFWFGIAIAIMVLFRAHVALLTVVALALALVAGRGVPTIARIFLVIAAVGSTAFLFGTVQAELRVDLSSVGSVANFVEQQTTAATRGVDDSLARGSFLTKLFSLLYRPLFFDTDGIFGLVASFQNLFMVAFTFLLLRNIKLWAELFRGSLAIRFATFHMVLLFFMLAFMYYNVGLGLRQREMATPALLVITVTIFMVMRLRSGAVAPRQGALRYAAT
jgi:hypothetical protein